jgi:hypothetical protein
MFVYPKHLNLFFYLCPIQVIFYLSGDQQTQNDIDRSWFNSAGLFHNICWRCRYLAGNPAGNPDN